MINEEMNQKYIVALGATLSVLLLAGFLVFINFDFSKIIATFSQLNPGSGKASLSGAVPPVAPGSAKIGTHTYQAPRVLQDDEFAIIKSGSATGKKKTIEIQLKSGATYTAELYEGQDISVMEPDGSTGYAVDDAAEIHNLSELYQDKSSIEAKVSPVVSDVLKKRDIVPVIIRFGGLQKPFAVTDTMAKLQEKRDKFSALREKIRSKIASNGNGSVKKDLSIINGISANISQAALESLRNDPNVQKIEYNGTVRGTLFESLDQIGAKNVWNNVDANNISVTGKGMRIAIVDSGVDYTHPDLGGCFGTGCKVAVGWDFENNDADPMDDFGHGTHVASIAAGKGVLNGVAPDATIYAYKVLGSNNSGSFENTILGIQRATDPNQDGDTSDHVDVGNLSLGSKDGNPLDSVSAAVDASSAAGVVWAVAAGNQGTLLGPESIDSPGCAASAVTVASTCKDSQIVSGGCLSPIAASSSRGPVIYNGVDYKKPDVAAPGNLICAARFGFKTDSSCGGDTIHKTMSGTSMATPHVAGALALLRQTYPQETPAQLKQRLKSTARDLGMDYNYQGAGEINLKAALPSNQQLTIDPGIWQIETDPTKKISTFSQTFSITPWVDVATLAVAVKNPAPGITIASNKTTLNVSGRRADTVTITITVDNDAAAIGGYIVPAAAFSSGSIDRGSIFASIKVKPSLIISGDNLDYGIDNPTLANWTSSAAAISITNLRTDIASTITWSAIGLQSGVTVNGLPSTITVLPGKTQIFDTSLKIDNALVPNGYYEGTKLKFTDGNAIAISSIKFYKAYYLDVAVSGATSPGYGIYVWDYSKKYSLNTTALSLTDPVRFYFLEPGKTDLIVSGYVKENIDVSSGNARVNVNLADRANKITWNPVDETGNPLKITNVLHGIEKKATGFNDGAASNNRIPVLSFNNVSANFMAYTYAISAGSPSKIYIMGSELGNGITASAVIANTAQDFKILNIKANSNRAEGVMFPRVRASYNNYSLQSATMSGLPALVQKIYYAGINASGFTISQESEYYSISNPPKTTDFPYVYKTPQIDLQTGEAEYFPGRGLGKVDIGSGSITNGWGPEFFAGKFNNTAAGIELGTVGCGSGYEAPFLRQDYSLQLYPAIPYLLKNSSGIVVKSGNITDRAQMTYSSLSSARVIIAASLAADIYTFEIPKFEYYIQGQPYYASAIATIKLGPGLSDYNPPAIGKFSFFSNGQISEGFIPNAANKMELSLDPVGGTLAAQNASYSIDGSTFIDATVSPGSPITAVDIPAIPDTASKLIIKVYAADAAGNDLTYKFEVPKSNTAATILADTAAPVVNVTAPASGSNYTTAQTVTVTASASDNIGVSKVEFYDGSTKLGTINSAPYTYAWAITAAKNGSHSLTAKAYDVVGNIGTSSAVAVTVSIASVDVAPPAVSLTSPASNASYTAAQTVNISAAASDNVGVTKVEFYDGSTKLGTGDTSSPYEYAWLITAANNGGHSLTAKAYDAAGNSKVSTAVNVTVNIVTVDTQSPAVSITAPSNNASYTTAQTVNISAAASDNVGVTKVEFYDGTAKLGTINSAPYTYAWAITAAKNGSHSLTAKAYDVVGNTKVSSAVNVTVNIATGCTSNASCDDSIYCNGAETCQSGKCVKGIAVTCNDSNACTSDTCSETAKVCAYSPLADNTSCASGVCCAGTCKAGAATCSGNGTICWNGSNQNLYLGQAQLKKFCLCAQGTYSYKGFNRNTGNKPCRYYASAYNTENWAVKSLTAMSTSSATCSDGKTYYTNQTYTYPK